MNRLKMLGAAGRRRCPRCRSNRIFDGYWTLTDSCPDCGMWYERDPGYWLGAMIINLAVTIGLFLVVFVGVTVGSWPDVPWTALLIGTMALNLIVPVLFYPISKTLFVALDLSVRPLSPDETEAAETRVSA